MFMLNHNLESKKCKWDVLREKVEFQINCSTETEVIVCVIRKKEPNN